MYISLKKVLFSNFWVKQLKIPFKNHLPPYNLKNDLAYFLEALKQTHYTLDYINHHSIHPNVHYPFLILNFQTTPQILIFEF